MDLADLLPSSPLTFEKVDELNESDVLEITPLSMIVETGIVYSVMMSPQDSDVYVSLLFDNDDSDWVEVGRAEGQEEMRDLWEETKELVNDTYSEIHEMGDSDFDSGDISVPDKD